MKRGGLLRPTRLGRFERLTCDLIRDLYREIQESHANSDHSDRFERLSILFIDNEAANALAIERDGERAIAIYVGLLRRLWAAFQLGLSRADFLEGGFDTPPIKLAQPPTAEFLKQGQASHLPLAEWPEERRHALWDLFQRALMFLLFHELGHHVRGHIDLVREHLGFDAIDELQAAEEAGLGRQLLRMLEFDADTEAIEFILVADKAEAARAAWSIDKSEAQGFQWLAAITTLFLALDLEQRPVSDQYAGSHPAPVHRAIFAVTTFARSYADLFGWSEEKREFYEEEAWCAAASIAEAMAMPEGRWHGEHTLLMDLDRYAVEETAFLDFTLWLTAFNQGLPAEAPAWLAAAAD